MSETYVFQILGLVLVAVGVGMLLNMSFYKDILTHYSKEPTAIYLNGILATTIGFLLVRYFYNFSGWTALLMVVGWLTLLKGLVILIMPKAHITMTTHLKNNTGFLRTMSIAVLVLGLLMLYAA